MTPYVFAGALNLMALGMALIVALRIAYGGRVPVADPIYALVRAVAVVLITFGWLAILISIGWFLGPILFVASLAIAAMLWRQFRLTQRRTHMSLLALAIERQIPLPTCVDALATELGGKFALRAGNFSADLRAGMPLPKAIARSRRVLPQMAELAAHIGQSCNRLAATLRDEISTHGELEPIRRAVASRMLYFVIVFSIMPLVLTFVFIKILPVFIRIFDDFEIELPAMTQVLIGTLSPWYVTVPTFWASIGGLIIMIWATLAYIGVPLPELPFTRWTLRRFDRATIQRALAFPAEQGKPLGPMIWMLAEHYPSWSIRDRLEEAAKHIENGQEWIASLRSQSLLGRADVAVLSAAERARNLPWALREMAESNERRLIYRLQALVQIGSIAVVVGLGMFVGFAVIALFLPLVKLIQSLT